MTADAQGNANFPKLLARYGVPHIALILNILIALFAVAWLGVMLAKGALRERVIALGPDRDLGLYKAEYLFGVFLVCAYVGVMLVGRGLVDTTKVASQPAFELVLFSSLSLLLQLSVIGMMIGKAMNSEAGFRKLGLVPRHPLRDLRWAAISVPVAIALAVTSGLALLLLSQWVGLPAKSSNHETLEQLVKDPSIGFIIQVIISAVIMAPLMEELIFRGVLQTCLVSLLGGRRWPALLIAAGIFSVTHAAITPWQDLVPLFVLGLVFGYLYERTGSLLTPILCHAGFNAFNVAIVLAMSTG